MQSILSKLQFLQKQVEQDSLKEVQPMMVVLMNEALEEMKDITYTIDVKRINYTTHYAVLNSIAIQGKHKAICDLHELVHLVGQLNLNIKRITVLINQLLQTNLYNNRVISKVQKFKVSPKTKGTIKTEQIEVGEKWIKQNNC